MVVHGFEWFGWEPKVQKARSNVADVHGAGDVFMFCDSSIAPLLDLRSRVKAVIDVLGSIVRSGVSLARSVELTFQVDKNSSDWACVSSHF